MTAGVATTFCTILWLVLHLWFPTTMFTFCSTMEFQYMDFTNNFLIGVLSDVKKELREHGVFWRALEWPKIQFHNIGVPLTPWEKPWYVATPAVISHYICIGILNNRMQVGFQYRPITCRLATSTSCQHLRRTRIQMGCKCLSMLTYRLATLH